MASNLVSAISSEPIDPVNKIKHTLQSLIAALAFAGAALFVSPAMAIEEPEFTLVESDGDFEIRDYAPILVAETIVGGERDDAASAGFRILAGYIFGSNQGSAKIAMTAPVMQSVGDKIAMTAPVTQSAQGSNWLVRFAMPKPYTKATLPKPNDQRISFVEIPARRVAVLRFSSMWTDSALNARKEELQALLKAKGLKPVGEPSFAFYDPPWKPYFWRRNEILQDIKK